MKNIKIMIYLLTSITGILFAIPFFIFGFLYRFAVGGFNAGVDYAEEDVHTELLK